MKKLIVIIYMLTSTVSCSSFSPSCDSLVNYHLINKKQPIILGTKGYNNLDVELYVERNISRLKGGIEQYLSSLSRGREKPSKLVMCRNFSSTFMKMETPSKREEYSESIKNKLLSQYNSNVMKGLKIINIEGCKDIASDISNIKLQNTLGENNTYKLLVVTYRKCLMQNKNRLRK